MLVEAIAIGLVLGFFLFEWTGLVAGGLIAPGYFALSLSTVTDNYNFIQCLNILHQTYHNLALIANPDFLRTIADVRINQDGILIGYRDFILSIHIGSSTLRRTFHLNGDEWQRLVCRTIHSYTCHFLLRKRYRRNKQ